MHSACTTIHTSNFTKCPLGTEKLTMFQTLVLRLLNANGFNPRCGSSVTTPVRLNEFKLLYYLKQLQFNVRFHDYSRQDKRTWIFCSNTLYCAPPEHSSSSLLGVINDGQNSSTHRDGYLFMQKLFSATCVHSWWEHYFFCHCPRNSTRRFQMARSSIHWDSYENMQTAWLLPFCSDKEVNVYLFANGDSYPRDAMRKERNVWTIYVPVVPFKSRKRCRILVQLSFIEQ